MGAATVCTPGQKTDQETAMALSRAVTERYIRLCSSPLLSAREGSFHA